MASHLLSSVCFLLLTTLSLSDGGSIGVVYGTLGTDLPSPSKAVTLVKSNGFKRVRVYDTDPAVLLSLAGTGIKVTVGLPNHLLYAAGVNYSFACWWVQHNVMTYHPRTCIEAIAVGNEVYVDPKNTIGFLIPAMKNIHKALKEFNVYSDIKISSPVALNALQNSTPSSAGSFQPELIDSVFKPMFKLLRQTGSYLMLNAYTFLAYESNSDLISLDYALFRKNPGVLDTGNGLRYFSLFDAQIDAVFAAMTALKYDDIQLVVTETGWPSEGDENEIGATLENAAAYNGNLVKQILTGGGTPLRPKADLTVFILALFNENKKTGPSSERNYGLFYPNEEKVYNIPFSAEDPKNNSDRRSPETGGDGDGDGDGDGENQPSWCVASDVGRDRLRSALDFLCKTGLADCRPIQPGSTCYNPNTLKAHASFAFNSYYQKMERATDACRFDGAAHIITHRPKFGKCDFPTGYEIEDNGKGEKDSKKRKKAKLRKILHIIVGLFLTGIPLSGIVWFWRRLISCMKFLFCST